MADDILNVSDEEFLNIVPPEEDEAIEEEEQTDGLQEEEESSEEVETTRELDNSEEVVENSNNEVPEEETEEVESNTEEIQQDDEPEEESSEDSTEEIEETETEEPETSIDYKKQYDLLTSPFKANGKEMQVANVEDARTLMMMGANYNKKMAGLKPHLKMVKMLENNDLLDEGKLNYLIDLSNKNPEAIKQLLKDSGTDPMDIDMDQESNYQANNYTVSDSEVELDQAIDSIKSSPKFNETLDVLTNQFDDASKRMIAETPSLIGIINSHMESGIYDQVMQVVESEKVLGRLNGLSDLEAYKQVGDVIQQRGGFKQQANVSNQQTVNTPPPKATNKVDPKLASRKKAASPTKGTKAKQPNKEFNPLSMSDEEFEKMASTNLL